MTDYNNLPDSVEVTYTDFVECQYCGLRFGHGETAAMQNHWRDCPADHPARVEIERLQAEVERLQAANARLVAACKTAVIFCETAAKKIVDDEYRRLVVEPLEQAITKSEATK